ncbi:pyridoxal-phosphate dependent enzyme [Streptomyces tailanensis]|uniref:pyridoxal-phosphate dependent enzyme n=1 Tax=Streptomyces tailanensis TaxID=2569858 RepID=UPI00122DDFB7|nr:pyridoxal-phosphate dependent enzyme [Streptomyces tailanensis]
MSHPTGGLVDTEPEALIARARTGTPLRPLLVRHAGGTRRLWLKLEQENPTGSIKYRTALGLLAALSGRRPLTPGGRVVESTSGNLGLALAHLLPRMGCRFLAVVDPKVPPAVQELMRSYGAEVREVTERDEHDGYLLTRLAMVAELRAADPMLRWTDQYHSPAGPTVHRDITAAELAEQTGGGVDALLVAVSTGGTLAGISEGLRARLPGLRALAVDVHGSLATGGRAHAHLLTGVGASRRSSLLRPAQYDRTVRVRDVEAFACCRMLSEDTGLRIGGSGGAVLAAYLGQQEDGLRGTRCPVAVVADGADNYLTTYYDDTWLDDKGIAERVHAEMAEARSEGLSFEFEQQSASPTRLLARRVDQ